MKKEKLSAASKSKLEAETKSNTELIDELIFMTSHSSVDDLDAEKVAAYLGTLDERAPIDVPLGENEADAWERVLEKTEVGNTISDKLPEQDERRRRSRRTGKILHSALLAAAFALVLSCVVAFAAGVNPFETVVKVAGDLIFFARNPSGELELPEGAQSNYRTIPEALQQNNIMDAMYPSWVPSDYHIDNINVKVTTFSVKLSAFFLSERGDMAIVISKDLSNSGGNTIEINGVEDENYLLNESILFKVNNDCFYLTHNMDINQITGTVGSYSYSVWGKIDEQEAKRVIQSLYG